VVVDGGSNVAAAENAACASGVSSCVQPESEVGVHVDDCRAVEGVADGHDGAWIVVVAAAVVVVAAVVIAGDAGDETSDGASNGA